MIHDQANIACSLDMMERRQHDGESSQPWSVSAYFYFIESILNSQRRLCCKR